jgi:DNA-binding NarL/FixJ family response regulator
MDIRMPDLDGIEATRRILAQGHHPPTKVLILTTFDLDEYVYEALRAGASGMTNNEIAAHLILGETTVKTHVTRILTKLGVRDRVQAVVVAYETGVVTPGQSHPG